MDKYIIGMDMSPLSEVNMDKSPDMNILTIKLSDFIKAVQGDIELKNHTIVNRSGFCDLDIIGDILPMDFHMDFIGLINVRFIHCDFNAAFNSCELNNVIFNHCKFYTSLFYRCNLCQVDFHTAQMDDCCFIRNDIYGVMLPQGYHIPMVCPETGSFTGWKKGGDGEIICLEIPADAKRSSANNRKCRCDKAKVVYITDKDGNEKEIANGWINPEFIYKVGEMVYSDKWDENRWNECSNGIHFFMTRDEAVKYKIT